jgi:hypothetical protein
VIKLARKDNGDIPAAVRALGVALSPREVVIQRANPALARLDPRLAQAKANGAMNAREPPNVRQYSLEHGWIGCREKRS